MASRMALARERGVARHLRRLRSSGTEAGIRPMNRRTEEGIAEWLKERRGGDGECLVPDMAGIARGKILPTNKCLSGLHNGTLRLPESIFGQMVTGADSETEMLTY